MPNGDAVAVLGCNQPAVEREFNSMLARVSGESNIADSGLGMLVAGEFGAGKSHLLSYLETQALQQNFVCSRVVISKETPLFDMEKVFKAAVAQRQGSRDYRPHGGGDCPNSGIQLPKLRRFFRVGQPGG